MPRQSHCINHPDATQYHTGICRVRITINEEKARKLGRLLYNIGLEKILLLEERDPQLHAISRVSGSTSTGWAAVTASLVGLVSYRLTLKGEEWWSCYGEYFSDQKELSLQEAYDKVISFIDECKGAAIQRDAKKNRIKRVFRGAKRALETLYSQPQRILASGSWLLNSYSRALKQEPWRKTIAFSVKMAYYAVRSQQKHPVPAPWDVPVPVDLRVSCITYSSGIVKADDWRDIMRDPRPAIKAWSIVAEESRIPALNIDSLLWMIGSAPRTNSDVNEVQHQVYGRLYPVLGPRAYDLSRLLITEPCR